MNPPTKPRGKRNLMAWMTHPLVVFASMGLGIAVGVYHKPLATFLAPLGDAYLALLEMCVVPILMSAIISGLGRLLSPKTPRIHFRRMLFFFPIGLALASAMGIAVGLWIQPGNNLQSSEKDAIGRMLNLREETVANRLTTTGSSIGQVLLNMVPKNIFAAMTQGPSLAILMFSILFGTALGLSRTTGTESVLLLMEGLYQVFLKIIFWVLYGLPFGVFGLYAGLFSKMEPGILIVLKDLVAACAIGSSLLLLIYALIIWKIQGSGIFYTLGSFRKTMLLALTSSAFATIPTTLRTMEEKLCIPAEKAGLIYPLGININRHGSVFQFALAAVFMTQLYNLPLNGELLTTIWIGSMLAGMAALAGLPGLGLLTVVLDFLGLPSKVAIVLITSIDTIMIPMLVLVTVCANCTLTIFVCQENKSQKSSQLKPANSPE